MPGIPDTYQGSELWDLSLVDPDNRRPVDFGERARLACRAGPGRAGAPRVDDSGAAKLHLVRSALRLRRRIRSCSARTRGTSRWRSPARRGARHGVCPRGGGEPGAVTIVPRLVLGLRQAGGWKDTTVTLPPGEWIDVFTGKRHGSAGEPSTARTC